jgi:sugar O-acyltransferase (sialic acid O-acetyltransferase NeuD family)
MNRKQIVLIGGGGHAKVITQLLLRLPQYEMIGYVAPKDLGPLLGYPFLGTDEGVPGLVKKYPGLSAVLAFGKVKAKSNRMDVYRAAKKQGLVFPALCAKSAIVAQDCSIGEGTVVMEGAVVQPGTKLGLLSIINTRACIDHDCVIGDEVHVAPGAVLSGGVSVGTGSLIGTGAAIIENIKIGKNCSIGAGAAVVADCEDNGTYVGVPAKKQASS